MPPRCAARVFSRRPPIGSTRPDSEAGDVVFDSSAEALQVLSGLFGKPLIRELPVTEADVQALAAYLGTLR